MVELFQKYRIIDSNDLQLLGDMFEQLLNKGFKQNEGQFFTPIPITCFIWKCLPLESIILDEQKNEVRYPKVIDYACGAGHFLTEGFREINEKIRELGLKAEKGWERDCIFGIEKDYRLARVSKISMFMHGADNGNIVFGDGLDNHNEKIVIENGQFDILVANPPYSVSAFKNHLELKHNELKILGIISKDGKEIETLFVERIAQLLKPNGIAAVILPSSILSNSSTTYIKAREEILKNFAVHAIVQFGSKTFGATGTNTVALFLKKNSEPPVKSEITKDNVNAIFENEELKITSDKNIFDSYCQKINVSKDEYLAFVKSVRNAEDYTQYKNHHYFGMYVKDFEESADFKKLKEDKLNKAFYDYALQIEKEKIYYFALVYRQHTLVVTAPSDNAEQEAFLGYSWSNRKGDEGIKIKSSTPQSSCGLLYNVYDEEHSIARYVKDTFLGIYKGCHSEQSEESILKYISVHSLKDMIDFSRASFDKAIKTSVQAAAVQIESKFPMVRMQEVCTMKITDGTHQTPEYCSKDEGIPFLSSKDVTSQLINWNDLSIKYIPFELHEQLSKRISPQKDDVLLAKNGTIGIAALVEDDKVFDIYVTLAVLRPNKAIILPKYLHNIANSNICRQQYFSDISKGMGVPNLHLNKIKEVKIPLPPLDVQKSIVAECEHIDAEYQNAQEEIADANKKISEIMETSLKNASDVYKLSNKDIFDVSIGRRILSTEINDNYDVPVYSANVFEPFGKINKLLIKDFSVPSVLWGIDGDWQVNVIAENQPFYPTDHCGILRIKNNQLEPKFVAYTLEKAGQKEGFKRSYRASIDRIEGMNIKLPPLAEQQKIVAQITALEEKITTAKRTMTECPEKKQAVLDKWLR